MSPFWRSFWVPFSSLFHKSGPRGPGPHPKVPTRHQHGPQGYPNGAQGCRNEAPRSPQSAQKPPNYTLCVSKWKPKVPQWSQKATQSAKETPQGPTKCHKDTHRCQETQLYTNALGKAPGCKKTYTNRPRPGARRRRRRSGRGLEGRAHQAARRRPRSGAEAGIKVTSINVLFLTSINWVPPLPPTHNGLVT